MGVSPLARLEIFATSAASRKGKELSLKAYLASLPQMDLSSIHAGEFFDSLMAGRQPNFEVRDDASLGMSLLAVSERSCYGSISISPVRVGHPTQSDWKDASELCRDALNRGLCDAAILTRGCLRKVIFLTFYSRAVIATPGFSKLAVLSGLDLLQEEGLSALVDSLDCSGSPSVYCERTWGGIVRECRNDPLFASAIRSPQ